MKATTLQGAGIGLRAEHYQTILDNTPDVPWFEVLTDNYMGAGGLPLYHLQKIREHYPLSFHGVGLSLASTDPVNMQYLVKLKQLVERFQPEQISDHLAWVSTGNHYAHELMPFPYTEEALTMISTKICFIEDFLGTQLIVENPSSYLDFNMADMTEWEFLQQLVSNTDCGLLIDINNVYVSARNNHFSASEYISNINPGQVKEIHLAGYEDRGSYLFDTHGHRIHDQVWSLYKIALQQFNHTPTLIEWDTDIPAFEVLQQEAEKARYYLNELQLLEASA